MTRKAFIGRFQPFHKGHKEVVENYRENDLVVAIDKADVSREREEPLTGDEREEIIRGCFPDIDIVQLETYKDEKEWCETLESKTYADVVITVDNDVKKIVEQCSGMKVEEHEMVDPGIYSGQEARRRIRSGEEWRYLIPACAKQKIEELIDVFKDSGIQYEYEPGWKKENAYYGTADQD